MPIFFVIMGVRTDLRVFGEAGVLSLAATLTAAAILGKQLCAFGVIGRGYDRVSIAEVELRAIRQEGVGRGYGVTPPRRNVT